MSAKWVGEGEWLRELPGDDEEGMELISRLQDMPIPASLRNRNATKEYEEDDREDERGRRSHELVTSL